jgi:hypothetical protein
MCYAERADETQQMRVGSGAVILGRGSPPTTSFVGAVPTAVGQQEA